MSHEPMILGKLTPDCLRIQVFCYSKLEVKEQKDSLKGLGSSQLAQVNDREFLDDIGLAKK